MKNLENLQENQVGSAIFAPIPRLQDQLGDLDLPGPKYVRNLNSVRKELALEIVISNSLKRNNSKLNQKALPFQSYFSNLCKPILVINLCYRI